MRFLLVNPFYPISETPSPPLGLAFLAAVLEKAGIEVKIADYVVTPYSKEALQAEIKSFKPQIVGITAVTMTFYNAEKVIKDVKSIDPDIFTVIGGPHTTFYAEETLNSVPELDFVILGEGEPSIVKLAKIINDKHTDFENIKGIVYRKNGTIKRIEPALYSVKVNELPVPSRHLIPLARYRALHMPVSMTTSRGCPFKCIFCVGRKMVGAKVRYNDPIKIVDELEYLSTLNFHQINIADDLFTANKKQCTAVCDEILKRNLKVQWSSFARVDTVSLEVLKKMKAAGCTAVSFGVETGSPEILKTIKKGITLDQVVEAAKMCVEADVIPHASFILGLPGETPKTLQETHEFGEMLKEIGVSYGYHLLAPFPGTAVRDDHEKYGIKILSNDWSEYHANKAIVETKDVSYKVLDKIAKHWSDELDNWLGEIKKRMEKGTAKEEDAWQLINLEYTVINYDIMMESAIEKHGFWKNSNSNSDTTDKDELMILAGKVHKYTDYDQHKVFDSLNHAYNNKNILYTRENDNITWRWADYL